MNYKILAASSAMTIGLVATIVVMTQDRAEKQVVERLTTSSVGMNDSMEPRAMIAPPPASSPPPSQAARSASSSFQGDDKRALADITDLESDEAPIVGQPRIAYVFGYSFRLPGDAIKPLQDRHADMCERRGPNICRIISMQQGDQSGDAAQGSLHLAIAAPVARVFGKELSGVAKNAEAELVSSSIQGDDLSKKIVDTEARLRTRVVLRDRLLDVLRNRRGTVAELVEAERGVAQVNEEIDQARSWLADMNSRVNFSQMLIHYSAQAGPILVDQSSFASPVVDALRAAGPTIGAMLAIIIRLLTIFLPLGLLAWILFLAWRRFGRPGMGLLTAQEPERQTT